MSIGELIHSGNLAEAITVATADVKRQPLRPEPRVVLAELMCFAGNLDRADSLVEAASKLHGGAAPGLLLLRHLLRGEVARQQWNEEGRLPQTRSLPSPELSTAIQAMVEFRASDYAAAANAVSTLVASDVHPGVIRLSSGEEHPVQGLRDLNDLTASVAELISTASGNFFWTPWTEISRLKFEPVKTLRDILWRPVECTFVDGSKERFFMPSLYAGTASASLDTYRLGLATDWVDQGGGLTTGVGLRMFLAGELTPSILEIAEIQFDQPGGDHGESR